MKNNQRGVALLIVLVIVFAMIAIATTITVTQRQAIMRTEKIDNYQQILQDVDSANRLITTMIQQSMQEQPQNESITSFDQPWSLNQSKFTLDDAIFTATTRDMRTCYNINVLHGIAADGNAWPDAVQKLFELMIEKGIEPAKAKSLTAKIWDYIDSDTYMNNHGGEDALYLAKAKPYLTANQFIYEISELRVVDGMTKSLFQKLQTDICALPNENLSLNINTMTNSHTSLLQVFSNQKLSSQTIHQWLKNRPLGGWKNVEAALSDSALNELSQADKINFISYLRVDSDYYRLDGVLVRDNVIYKWYTLMQWYNSTVLTVQQIEVQ